MRREISNGAGQVAAPDSAILLTSPRSSGAAALEVFMAARSRRRQPHRSLGALDAGRPAPGGEERHRPLRRRTFEEDEMTGQLYELPFRAEDLEPGERLSTRQHKPGTQGLGKDIGVRRHVGSSTWSSGRPGVPTDRNESLLVYGKPFYAMADGVVVAGWRNAPDNPGPGQTHPERETGRIGGGGNCLWVLQDDGVMALYAHAQPGSIPRRLVPIDAELLSGPKPDGHEGFHPETVIPRNERVRVRRGDFLGVCGNSGRSGGPHLHVHMEAGKSADGSGRSTPHPMTFARGLATPRNDNKADIDAWTRFAGETIPDGEVLVWPPRSLAGEYARHGFPVSDYQRMFDHLVDSGFSPHWLDGYSVGGEAFLNFVFRPAEVPFRAFHGLDRHQLPAAVRRGREGRVPAGACGELPAARPGPVRRGLSQGEVRLLPGSARP